RPQRQRRVAQRHGNLDVLHEVEAEPAPLLRDRVAEQPHLRRLSAQVGGNGVGFHDLAFARNDAAAHEVVDLAEDVREDVVGDVGIAGVHGFHYQPLIEISPIPNVSISDTVLSLMDVHQLRAFLAVAEALHFGRAAAGLRRGGAGRRAAPTRCRAQWSGSWRSSPAEALALLAQEALLSQPLLRCLAEDVYHILNIVLQSWITLQLLEK